MTEETNKQGASTGKPESGKASPDAKPNPPAGDGSQGKASAEFEQLKTELVEAKRVLETYRNQVKGSQDEALRLKQKVEDLEDQIVSSKPSQSQSSDSDFQRLVQQRGETGAVRHIIREELSELRTSMDSILGERSKAAFATFRTDHPGLTDEVLGQFNQELDRMKQVYSDPETAMRNAWAVMDGSELDRAARAKTDETRSAETQVTQTEKEKETVTRQAAGGDGDRTSTPTDTVQSEKIAALRHKALRKEANGQNATDVWAELEKIENAVAARV